MKHNLIVIPAVKHKGYMAKLINDLIEQIVKDVHKGDVTAIHELISKLAEMDSVIVTMYLKGFLSEQE